MKRTILLLLHAAIFSSYVWGAAETIRPSGAFNDVIGWAYAGIVTPLPGDSDDIDEDTSGSDGIWICVDDANGNCDNDGASTGASNQATNADFPFANPVNPPVSTTDAQQVCVRMRKTQPTTDPTFTVDILEGNTVRVNDVISQAVTNTSGGVEYCASWTFTPGDWTDTSGDSIEVGIDCPAPGGSPGSRAACELGSIELNLDTAAASSKRKVAVVSSD